VLEKKKEKKKKQNQTKNFSKKYVKQYGCYTTEIEKFCLFFCFCNKGKRVKAAYVVLYFIT